MGCEEGEEEGEGEDQGLPLEGRHRGQKKGNQGEGEEGSPGEGVPRLEILSVEPPNKGEGQENLEEKDSPGSGKNGREKKSDPQESPLHPFSPHLSRCSQALRTSC